MQSHQACQKGKSKSTTAALSHKGKQKAQPMLDLDHNFSDLNDDEDAAEGFIEMEMKKMELLDGLARVTRRLEILYPYLYPQ
jgi:hypothetical protein